MECSIRTLCTFSDFFWSVSCTNLVFKLFIIFLKCQDNKHSLYWSVLVLADIEKLFSTICYFLSYFCWSVNCISRVSKFHNFSWHAFKPRQGLYLRTFSIAIYGKLNFNFPVLFLAFFIAHVTFLVTFYQSVSCMSWVWFQSFPEP